jgi:DDE superfamily endonuclease
LDVATGKVTAACHPRHRHQEVRRFLKQVARAHPDGELHVVMDNYAAHKRIEVRDWLAANPRVHVHFTPTSGSWLNLVVRHEVARDAVVFVEGGWADAGDVAPGPVRKDRPGLGVRCE